MPVRWISRRISRILRGIEIGSRVSSWYCRMNSSAAAGSTGSRLDGAVPADNRRWLAAGPASAALFRMGMVPGIAAAADAAVTVPRPSAAAGLVTRRVCLAPPAMTVASTRRVS